jgi:hypothetical protein
VQKIYEPWVWHFLSRNPNITIEFIDCYIDQPWNWGSFGLSSNPKS